MTATAWRCNPIYSLEYLRGTGHDPAALQRVAELAHASCSNVAAVKRCVWSRSRRSRARTRVLPRGNWQDESGPIVAPAVPEFLKAPIADAAGSKRLTRLDLANWLVSPENPLTARVFVNRLWKQFFGMGLSARSGRRRRPGRMAVHPELLDWLAVEFRESGWDVKHMVR